MSDFPDFSLPTLGVITPWSSESLGTSIQGITNSLPTSGTGIALNTAVFYPFRMNRTELATKMFLVTGASPVGNVDVGIYDSGLRLIVSSGAVTEVSSWQEFDITDTWLTPGDYFMALSVSSASTAFFRTSSVDDIAFQIPAYTMASAHPLPSTATLTKTTASTAVIVAMGIVFNGTLI